MCSWRNYPKAAIMPAICFSLFVQCCCEFECSEYGKDSWEPELSWQPVWGWRAAWVPAAAVPVAAAPVPMKTCSSMSQASHLNSRRILTCLWYF